tara:strand:- start:3000 stop:3974 length:975 start_codon:yes stop_codon:yes gene_type:complete
MKSRLNKIAKKVIQIEIEALKKLKLSINKSFSDVIQTITKCRNGRIIISGVGKSGIIARKWAATLSSTGTPSFFLDASNASHGDMGQITSDDVVILISLSGDSKELKNIIKYCSIYKNLKLIGITGNKKSNLYKYSDVKFLIPNIIEAGPGNFIPTSSTTTQLALGDAIAIGCMQIKKFGKNQFKKLHPAGSLGAKLKTVKDLMLTGNKIPFVKETVKMKFALKEISQKKLGVLLVKKNHKTIGILTDGDIKRLAQKYNDFPNLEIKSVMKKNPISINLDTLALKALSIMNNNKITCLCVHKGNLKKKTLGIIHIHNILDAKIN